LRRFSADWLRTNIKDVSVESRFERVQGLSWYDEKTKEETPINGLIHLTWWPKPPMSEFEMLKRLQDERRKAAQSGE
jgi:hypothetical protein